ncbi:MAG: hypothetical protein LUG18_01470 [Candidatus Azobacteroides sp.]|nr:hypothetical protein [Candidatus Azobacteroides sp.]
MKTIYIAYLLGIILFFSCNDKNKVIFNYQEKGVNPQILTIADSLNKIKSTPIINIEFYTINDSNFVYFLQDDEALMWINNIDFKVTTEYNMGYIQLDSTQLIFYDLSRNGIFEKFIEKDSLLTYVYSEETLLSKPAINDPIADIYYIEEDRLIYLGKKYL